MGWAEVRLQGGHGGNIMIRGARGMWEIGDPRVGTA